MNRTDYLSLKTRKIPFGVLSDHELLLAEEVQGKRVLHSRLLHTDEDEIGGLLEQLWNAEVNTVWVMPETRIARIATCAWLERARPQWTMLIHPNPQEQTRPVSAQFWPLRSEDQPARRLALAFPAQAGWGWNLSDATGLLATVTYLDQVLGRPVIDTPERLAQQLLTEATMKLPVASWRSSPVDLTTLLCSDGTPVPWQAGARDLNWMRPFTLVEQRQKYLHKYTHLFRYAEAALDIPFGMGAPMHDSTGRSCDGTRPGIWRGQVERMGSVFDGTRLPAAFDGEWMSTPLVKCCRSIGYQVSIREGYYWPQSQTLLHRWANMLWQAAEALQRHPQRFRHQQARANVIRTLQLAQQKGVHQIAQDQAAGGWGRPDWWTQLVGRSRALTFAHLVPLVRKGTMPVLITPDAFWVVSNAFNPLVAVPGLISPARWNGYAAGYTVPLSLSSEVRTIFHDMQSQPEQAALALDALAYAEAF